MNKLYLLFAFCLFSLVASAQVVVINPTLGGGFESSTTFAGNNWTVLNGPFNQWAVGTGSFIGTRGAYIGNATTFVGTSNAAVNHFYSGVLTIPATATNITLSFRLKQPVIDANFDSVIVATCASTTIPVVGTHLGTGYTRRFYNTSTVYANYTAVSVSVASLAGTSSRLVFSYVNDGADPIGVPAVDSISLTYCDVITGVTTVCQGGSTVMANAATGGVWSSSNAAVGSVSTSGTVTGLTDGTTVISYTAGSCPVTTKVVTVNTTSPLAITGTTEICPGGGTTTLSDATAGGVWSSLSAGVSVNASTGLVTGNTSGTSVVTYAQGGCQVYKTVTVDPLPFAYNVTGGGAFCVGGSEHIGLDGSDIGINYYLSDGSGVVAALAGTGSALDFGSFTTLGTYTVTGQNATTTCSGAMSGNAILANATPVTPSVTISGPSSTTCSGGFATFTATATNGGAAPDFDWLVNGTDMGMGFGSFTYSPANGDALSVILYPNNICTVPATATSSFTVTVTPTVLPSVTVSTTHAMPGCVGSPVTFSATPSAGGSTPTYRWTRGGINVATGPNYTCIPADGDAVVCTLFSNYVCRLADSVLSSTFPVSMTVGIPAPSVTITATPGNVIATGDNVTFAAIAAGAGIATATYQWYVNSIPVTGATNATYENNTLVNMDIVTCRVTNSDACAHSTLASKDIFVNSLGVNTSAAAANISIAPNPNSGSFTISGSFGTVVDAEVAINITNMLGQLVYNANPATHSGLLNTQIALPDLAPGMYTVSLHSASQSAVLHFVLAK